MKNNNSKSYGLVVAAFTTICTIVLSSYIIEDAKDWRESLLGISTVWFLAFCAYRGIFILHFQKKEF